MPHEDQTTTEVLDPVCGMTISPEDAVGHVEHKGHTYYFCHESCLEKFQADPTRYLELKETIAEPASADSEIEYTCPMDPEIVRNQPGNCPICGMALEPRTVVLDADN